MRRSKVGDDGVLLWAASEEGSRATHGAAWRGLLVPAEAALMVAELQARRVVAARQRGKANPRRSSSPE